MLKRDAGRLFPVGLRPGGRGSRIAKRRISGLSGRCRGQHAALAPRALAARAVPGGRIGTTEADFISLFTDIPAKLLAGALAATLAVPFLSPAPAFADSVSDAEAALSHAEERMSQIKAEYDALLTQADELQSQIDDATQGVLDAQSAMQEGRSRLGQMFTHEYKTGGISLLNVLIDSQNIADLIDNMQYLDAMQRAQSAEIDAQRQREQAFNDALDDMNKKKDEQQQAIADAEAKTAEAEQVVSNASAALESAQAEAAEASRLAELQAAAAALTANNAGGSGSAESGSGNAGNGGSVETGGGNQGNNGNNGGNNENNGGGSVETGGWLTGAASAYGAESDGTLGATTATGAVVTESSMGVAVPMSLPNYRSYFGRAVEISYGGTTVVAVVNDCGNMGGGSRALDLQPGVWKALGASSCYDWGVRTVSYRFL